jgi:Transposase DDE domain
MSLLLTAGQRGDSPQFQNVLDKINVPRMGAGRPRTRPERVRADKAYSSRANRAYLRRRGIAATIPEPADLNLKQTLDVPPRVHDHAQPRPSTQNSFPSGSARTVHGTSP